MSKKFKIIFELSNASWGAVLFDEINDNNLPLSYTSHSFNDDEILLEAFKKKLLGMSRSVNYFQKYLQGRSYSLFSDHHFNFGFL